MFAFMLDGRSIYTLPSKVLNILINGDSFDIYQQIAYYFSTLLNVAFSGRKSFKKVAVDRLRRFRFMLIEACNHWWNSEGIQVHSTWGKSFQPNKPFIAVF